MCEWLVRSSQEAILPFQAYKAATAHREMNQRSSVTMALHQHMCANRQHSNETKNTMKEKRKVGLKPIN